MNIEENRIKTFENYKSTDNPNYDTASLAKVGFYATGTNEQIKCHFCDRILFRLLPDDPKAVELHLKTNSSCPLIRRRTTDNVEHQPLTLDTILPQAFNDVAGVGIRLKYPEFVFLDKRVRSFENWTLQNPKAADLANAGFFSLGDEDKVACFSCGLGLMQFDETDIPFEEHARWSPTCDFMVKTKGLPFIKEVARNLASK